MERYNNEISEEFDSTKSPVSSRVSKHTSLYQDIKSNELSRVRNNDNIKVIENNGKTIDIDKIKRYINEINDQPRIRRKSVVSVEEETNTSVKEEKPVKPKDYDINRVLEKAKETREIDYDRERYKKLRDTQYDILSKLDMYNDKDEEIQEEEFNTEERTLIDLINTVTIHKGDVNLLEELMGGDEEEKTESIEKEIEKNEINKIVDEASLLDKKELEETFDDESKDDKFEKTQELVALKDKTMQIDDSFYTNSMSFGKKDFEGFEELEKNVKKNGLVFTLSIIILIVFIIVTLVIVANYVFDLGLF